MSRLTRAETERLRWYYEDADGAMGSRGIDYAGHWNTQREPDDPALEAVRKWRRVAAIVVRCSHRTQATLAARWQGGRVRHETGLRGDLVNLLPRTATVRALAEVQCATPLAVLVALATSTEKGALRTLLAASCEAQALWNEAEEEYAMVREEALDSAALAVTL